MFARVKNALSSKSMLATRSGGIRFLMYSCAEEMRSREGSFQTIDPELFEGIDRGARGRPFRVVFLRRDDRDDRELHEQEDDEQREHRRDGGGNAFGILAQGKRHRRLSSSRPGAH